MQKIVLVGQPRSGTSMIMRMLEAGGIDCEYGDKENKEKQEQFRNIYGFFETPKPSYTKCFKCWTSSMLKKVPEDWKIIYIERDIPSVVNSWKSVLKKDDVKEREDKIMENRIVIKNLLSKRLSNILKLSYNNVHENPLEMAKKIKEFIYPIPFDEIKASKMVDKNLFIDRKLK